MIQRISIYLLCALMLVAWGFHLGSREELRKQAATDSATQDAALVKITTSVNQQAAALSARMAVEQAKSLALDLEQNRLRAEGFDLELEISHAQFEPAPPVAGADPVVCPRATGSPEFVRLYNAAAAGGHTDAAGAAATR